MNFALIIRGWGMVGWDVKVGRYRSHRNFQRLGRRRWSTQGVNGLGRCEELIAVGTKLMMVNRG